MKYTVGFLSLFFSYLNINAQIDVNYSIEYLNAQPVYRYYEFVDGNKKTGEFLQAVKDYSAPVITLNPSYHFLHVGKFSASFGIPITIGIPEGFFKIGGMLDFNDGWLAERRYVDRKKIGYFLGVGIGYMFTDRSKDPNYKLVQKSEIPAGELIYDLDIDNLKSRNFVELRDFKVEKSLGLISHVGIMYRFAPLMNRIALRLGVTGNYHYSVNNGFNHYSVGLIFLLALTGNKF